MPRTLRRATASIIASAAGAIVGATLGGPWIWLHYLCKPLATMLVLWLATRLVPSHSARYRACVLAGIVFSLFGDVFLMLPDLFLPGLVAFLLAHLCFIAAFFPGGGWIARIVAVAGYAAIGAANLHFLLPRLPPQLVAPVLAYVGALVLMAGFAGARAWTLRRNAGGLARPARFAAIGGVLFLLSDSLLAWDKFGGGIPQPSLLVLATYYASLWCVALSVKRD